jgi:hypothetical protein
MGHDLKELSGTEIVLNEENLLAIMIKGRRVVETRLNGLLSETRKSTHKTWTREIRSRLKIRRQYLIPKAHDGNTWYENALPLLEKCINPFVSYAEIGSAMQ